MISWVKRQKAEARKKKAAARQRRADIRETAVAVAKVLPHFTARWHQERAKKLRAALDILAGEGLAP